MEINEIKENHLTILEPIGRLDTNTSSEFENKLVQLFEKGEIDFVIDLGQIDYISSAGLRVLLLTAKKVKNLNGSLVLCSISNHIQEVFDIAGFTPIFSIVATRSDAIGQTK